jgi:hypothetical protein
VAGGHSFCLFFIYSYIHSFNHIRTIHLSGNFGRQLWPATLAGNFLFIFHIFIHTFLQPHSYNTFIRQIGPETLAGNFGRQLWPATLAGNFVIIGAANRKIFKKEKCHKQFAAPRLLG